MNTIANPLMNLHLAAQRQATANCSSKTMASSQQQQQQQQIYQAAAINDLARRHYAQTISRASNLGHLQLLGRYQQQQQQLCCLPASNQSATFALEPAPLLSPIQQQQQKYATFQQRPTMGSLTSALEQQALLNKPLCRCRVMYLGSSVPHITKNGLHGIQEPLRHLYPDEQFNNSSQPAELASGSLQSATIDISHLGAELGIDSWLSVWSNGLLLENVDEFGREIKRFFSIESLHYCAAVRYFDASNLIADDGASSKATLPTTSMEPAPIELASGDSKKQSHNQDQNNNNNNNIESQLVEQPVDRKVANKSVVRFLPLDAPLFQCPGMLDAKHPPMFSAILRRTSGIKVLECHAFICRRDAAANALVRCCTHAYADLLSARRVSGGSSGASQQLAAEQAPASAQHRRRHLYKPTTNQMYHHHHHPATSHLSLARRGRHLYRDSSLQPPMAPASSRPTNAHYEQAEVDNNGGRVVKQQHNSSSDDTRSSLCDGRDGTNSSGDDNYAIISRHQSRANSRGPADSAANALPTKRAETSGPVSKRAAARRLKAVGSSRSLYDDFMPNDGATRPPKKKTTKTTTGMASAAATTAAARDEDEEARRLVSHSMDLLQLHCHADACDRAACACLASTPAEAGGDKQATKRHSKSMQNLRSVVDFPCQRRPSLSSSRASILSTAAATSAARSAAGGSTSRRRPHRLHRSTKRSLQDVRLFAAVADDEPAEPTTRVADPMRGEHQATDSNNNIYDKPAANYYERIAEPHTKASSTASRKRDRSRFVSQQHQHAGGPNSAGSGSASARRLSSHLAVEPAAGFDQHHHLAAPSMQLYTPAAQLPSLAPQFSLAAAHHLSPVALPLPMLAGYPVPAPPIDYYGGLGGPLLKYPAGYCLAAPPPPPLDFHMATAAAYSHQQQQQQRQLANTLLPAHYYTNNSASALAACTLSKRRHRQQVAGASSLAARFRCLSPPLNFIAGSGAKAGPAADGSERRNAISNGASLSAPAAGGEPANKTADSRESGAAANIIRGELRVVSAKPGFISHSSATGGAGKRLSWIKRLSLTMSGGSSSPAPPLEPQPTAADTTTATSGQDLPQQAGPKQQLQQKKRTSRLFAASLSLGRTTRRNSKQQPALVTPAAS